MDFTAIWAEIQPYFSAITDGLSIGTIITLVVCMWRAIQNIKTKNGKLAEVLSARLESLINDKVVPDTVRLDISTVVNKELARINEKVTMQVGLMEKKFDAVISILMNLTAFKNMSEEEKNAVCALIGKTTAEANDLQIVLSDGAKTELTKNSTSDNVEVIVI